MLSNALKCSMEQEQTGSFQNMSWQFLASVFKSFPKTSNIHSEFWIFSLKSLGLLLSNGPPLTCLPPQPGLTPACHPHPSLYPPTLLPSLRHNHHPSTSSLFTYSTSSPTLNLKYQKNMLRYFSSNCSRFELKPSQFIFARSVAPLSQPQIKFKSQLSKSTPCPLHPKAVKPNHPYF